MFCQRSLLPVLALALGAGSASAGVIATYTSSAAFTSANASLFAIDLGSLSSGANGLSDASGLVFSDVNGQASLLSVTNCGTDCHLQTASTGFEILQVQLPASVTAMAFQVVLPTTGSNNMTIYGPGFTTLTFNGSSTPQFFGVNTDGTATTLTISPTNPGVQVGIADAEGGPADTPEAATLIMIGTGLMFFRWWGRRAA